MKKLIVKIFVFITTFFLCYILIIIILGLSGVSKSRINFVHNTDPGNIKKRISTIKNIEEIDILVIGSSRAFMGFNADIFNNYNYSIYTVGSVSQTPIISNYIFKKYLTHKKINTVILEVHPHNFISDGVEGAIDICQSLTLDKDFSEVLFKVNNI